MQKISVIKKANYYKKNKFDFSENIYKKTVDTIEEAKQLFDNEKINHIVNKTGISVTEEVYFIYKINQTTYGKYTKFYDFDENRIKITKPSNQTIPYTWL